MSVNDVIAETQLPAWMKQAKRGVDWGALLIIGFSLFAAWSFFTQTELPATNNTEAYVYRSADYASLFEQEIAYTRWSPHAVHGYGAPIPHYYPSGAAYVGGLISYLFTNNPITAVRMLYAFSLILAGSMTYTFVAQRTTALAGITAALLYVFSPYIMVTISHIEGDLPLAVGSALLPSLLWAVNRLLKRYQAIDFLLIAVIVAMTIFTVPIMLLQGILAVLVLLAVEFYEQQDWGKLRTLTSAILAGVLLSAFYWLPAIMQFNDVTWQESLFEAAPSRLTFQELFTASQVIDSGITVQHPVYNLGWGLLFALAVNIPVLVFGKADKRFSLSFFALAAALLTLILFFTPERTSWLVLIVFCLAIAGSYVGQAITVTGQTSNAILLWAIIGFALVSTMPLWIIPEPDLAIASVTPEAQDNFEQAGYGYVGIPYGLPIPSNLSPKDAFNLSITNKYDENTPRLQNLGLTSSLIDESSYVGRYTISSDEATSLIYNRAYYAGWHAVTNTGNLTLRESENNLIRMNIPANTETNLILRLGFTTMTLIAWSISAIALLLCIGFWWNRWQPSVVDYDQSILLPSRTVSLLLLILISLGLMRGIASTLFSDILTQQPQYSMESALSVRANYDRTFQLLAYEFSQDNFSSGDDIQLTAYWTVTGATDAQYLVQLRVTDDLRRTIFYESGYSHAGYYPTNRWQSSSTVSQTYELNFTEDLVSGNYLVAFDVYMCTETCSADIMTLHEAQGQIRILRPLTID